MNRYPSYKPSGVKWLGEIPSHWEIVPLKHVVTYNDEVLLETENNNKHIKYVEIGDVDSVSGVKRYTEYAFKDAPSRARRITRKGDVIVSTVRTYLRAVAPIIDDDLIVSTGFAVLRAKTIEKRFLAYYLMSDYFVGEVIRRSVGTSYPAINANELVSISFVCPSLSEQSAIAAYLDTATAKIDAAIAQQQKMIDLLNERKQIIINRAVTKGLNPDAKMKDSGVEWIGEVPEHWEVVPMKYCMKIKNGMDYKHIQTELGIPVIGSGGQFAYASDYMYDGEVVFFGRKGTVDRPLYFKGKFWAVDTMFYTIPNSKILGKYLYYQGLTIPYKYYSTSTALPSMTQTDLGNNPICLPSIIEQKEIVDYLDKQCEQLDFAIANCNFQISLLQERKQIIINEVVTGKVKICK